MQTHFDIIDIDPCQLPECFRDRFAQLTLSSKKRKEIEEAAAKDKEKKETEMVAQEEKRRLSSKNLLDLFTDDESETEAEELNKLFRSCTTNNTSRTSSESDQQNITEDSSSSPVTNMEKLEVVMSKSSVIINPTEGENIFETIKEAQTEPKDVAHTSVSLFTKEESSNNELDMLLNQIKSLGLKSPDINSPKEKQISLAKTISSDTNNFPQSALPPSTSENIVLAEIISDNLSEVVSLESHRSSTPRRISLELVSPKRENVFNDDISIVTISSTDTSASPLRNFSYNLSETDNDEVIVLTDSDHETDSCPVNVSSIRTSGQTNIASTLSNTAADRIEAFLHDIPDPTEIPNVSYNEIKCDSFIDSQPNYNNDDSIEIAETSSEHEEIEKNTSCPPEEMQSQLGKGTEDEKVKSSEPPSPPSQYISSSYVEKINISATIKIKVQISEPIITTARISAAENESNEDQSNTHNEIHASCNESNNTSEQEFECDVNNGQRKLPEFSTKKCTPIKSNRSETQNNISSSQKTTPKGNEAPPKKNEATPKRNEVAPERNKPTSKRNEVTPERNEATPKRNEVTPKRNEATPKKNGNQTNEIQNESGFDLDEKAKELLDQLYGNTWQTPEIIKSLDRRPKTEESRLDFTKFHENINADLESTRLTSQRRETPQVLQQNKVVDEFKKPFIKANTSIKETKIAIETSFNQKKSGRKIKRRVDHYVSSPSNEDSLISDDSWVNTSSSSMSEEEEEIQKTRKKKQNKSKTRNHSSDKENNIVYLDLSTNEIKVVENCNTPAANNDIQFNERLQEILKTCEYKDKEKLEATPKTKTKRKLFTPRFGEEDENVEAPPLIPIENTSLANDSDYVKLRTPLPSIFTPINKQLEAVKIGTPIFSIKKRTPTSSKKKTNLISKFQSEEANSEENSLQIPTGFDTPKNKFGFLKSLDVSMPKILCHPDALYYKENFKARKDELVQRLYKIFNEKVFNNKLDVPIVWNKRLVNTAGRCTNKKKYSTERSSKIELSEKVLTSADRLRCTLLHELCHAATWVFNGEHGHGATWKAWARKANDIFPELPEIRVCHQYDIEYKYTYKCTLCAAKSHAHSKSKKVENIRCSYCHGAIEIFLNKKDKSGNIIATPVKGPSGFAKFVKEKYKSYKTSDRKHADVMKLLSNEFASLNVSERKKY